MKSLLLLFLARILTYPGGEAGNVSSRAITSDFESKFGVSFNLAERLRVFEPLSSRASYSITICADIPDNNNPDRVHVGKRPGHVFVILQKTDSGVGGSCATLVFGFYPFQEQSSLLRGNVTGKISDNSTREYNASLSKALSAQEFQHLLHQSQQLATRKYNLRTFNCYDYVIAVFNSISVNDTLPVTRVKLPWLLGRAGSPCGLYRDLERWKTSRPQWSSSIHLGTFIAPNSGNS